MSMHKYDNMGYANKSKKKGMMYGGGSPHGFNAKAGVKTYGRRNPKQNRVSNNKMNKPRMTGY